jgi:hypothetical protein
MQKAIASSRSQAHLEKNRSYLKYLVAHKGNAAGVRPQVAYAEDDNAVAKPLRRSTGLRGRTLSAPEGQAGFTFWSSNIPMYRRANRIVAAAASLVHFIANNGETLSSTSQLHMEDKSQFSESLGTSHRAG